MRASEAIKVRHGHGMVQPIGVKASIHDRHEAAERLMKAFACNDLLYGRTAILRAKIGVESGLPHRYEKDHVALLTGVLLRGLHLDCLMRCAAAQRREEIQARVSGSQSDRV